MSVSVMYMITAADGRLGDLKSALIANLPQTKAFEGNEYVRLVEPRDKGNTLVLVMQWVDLDSFKAYKAWRSESGTSAVRPELVEHPPELVFSDILF